MEVLNLKNNKKITGHFVIDGEEKFFLTDEGETLSLIEVYPSLNFGQAEQINKMIKLMEVQSDSISCMPSKEAIRYNIASSVLNGILIDTDICNIATNVTWAIKYADEMMEQLGY